MTLLKFYVSINLLKVLKSISKTPAGTGVAFLCKNFMLPSEFPEYFKDTSHPFCIDGPVAVLIGLNKSIMMKYIHYLLQNNERNKNDRYISDNKIWITKSIRDLQLDFEFWDENTIRKTINELIKDDLIFKKYYKNDKKTHMRLYTINYEKYQNILSFFF